MRLDVTKSRELQATIYALRSVDKTLAKQIRQQTKRVAGAEWQRALERRASTQLEQRVLSATSVITVSNQNVRAASASKGRPLSGGLSPKLHGHAVEFGANAAPTTYERTSPRGTVHRVRRTVGTQLRPRNAQGYVFWPTAREMIPRLASLWVQTTVRTIGNALEGKAD